MANGGPDTSLAFRMLGPLQVLQDEKVLPLGGPRQRATLAALLLNPQRVVHADRLVELVWGEHPPQNPAAAIHVGVSRLRAVLGEGVLQHQSPGYVLDVAPEAIDAVRFAALAQQGQAAAAAADHSEARRLLTQALGLWRGETLADLGELPFVVREREHLDQQRLAALEARLDADLAVGDHTAVIGELERLVDRYPTREAFARQLMTALYRSDRQAEALEVYQRARRLLVEELGIEPSTALTAVQQQILRHDPPHAEPLHPAGPPQNDRGNLPYLLTSFVGRGKELADVTQAVEHGRLVTLTGSGGSGKTRLAIEAGRRMAPQWPHGVWLIELSAVSEDPAVARTIAATLGILEQPQRPLADSIATTLRDKQLLLILDNCEHLLGAVATLVTQLLHTCRDVRVIATSRQPLGVDGETNYRVPSLVVPPKEAQVSEIAESEGVQLLVERARAATPAFTLTAANASAAAKLCRGLDGIPLAIELAAAQLRSMTLEELLNRLKDRFSVLTAGSRTGLPRHQTLRATVDWSYDLLEDSERSVFEELSVFAGGFTLDAAEAVCASRVRPDEVLPALCALVDKSLVTFAGQDTGRYHLLETLRQYGDERLGAAGREAEVRQRHAHYFRSLAERAGPQLIGPDQLRWIERVEDDHENLRRALTWALEEGNADVGLKMVASLWAHWWRHGHIPEGDRWTTRVLNAFGDSSTPELLAAVMIGGGHLTWKLGDFDRAEALCTDSLAVCRELSDEGGAAASVRVLAMVARERGDVERAEALLGESLATYRRLGDTWSTAASLNLQVSMARSAGDYDRAAQLLEESTPMFKQVGDVWGIAWSLWLGGRVATRAGDLVDGAEQLRESTRLAQEVHHGFGVVLGVAGLAGVAAAAGDHERATRLLGATDMIEGALGFPVRAIEREDSHLDLEIVTKALDPEDFKAAWDEGMAMTLSEAVAYALEE